LTAAFVVLAAVKFFVGLDLHDYGRQGFAPGTSSEQIETVVPHSAAYDAGLRVGDTVLYERMGRQSILDMTDGDIKLTSRPIHLVIQRGGRIMHVDIRPRALDINPVFIAQRAVGVATEIIVEVLVIFVLLRAPGTTAIALWAFAVSWLSSTVPFGYHAPLWLAIVGAYFDDTFTSFASTAGLLILTVHALAPGDRRVRYEIAALIAALIIALPAAAFDTNVIALRHAPSAWLVSLNSIAELVPDFITLGVVAIAFFRVSGVARVRLGWLAFATAALAAQALLQAVLQLIPGSGFFEWTIFVNEFLSITCIAALTFAIARGELFGIAFVVNRTVIFAVTTALLVGFFAALNWLVGSALKSSGLTLPVDAALAGILGLLLNFIRRRVDHFVDRVFFRKRYDAQARLRRVGRGMMHLVGADLIARTYIDEACAALELTSGALFRASNDGGFTRAAATNWTDGTAVEIAADDPLVVHVAGSETWLSLERVPHSAALPHGAAHPSIAFPLWSGNVLGGIALFSRHRSSAALDPEEAAVLEAFTASTALAFDRAGAAAFQTVLVELDRLRRQLELR
jgi:hypothetical protein